MAEKTTTAEKDPAEYDALIRDRENTSNSYDACENRISDLEYNKSRLKKKYEWVTGLKETFGTEEKQTKKLLDQDHKWKGSTYQDFSGKLELVIEENKTYYTKSLDYAHDEINNKLTEIENKLLEEKRLLGKLWSKLNTIINKIENWWN